MHPQRIEKHPSNPNILLSMEFFYHILPTFSYLIKLNKWNISALCYATSEYEVSIIPSLEEMALSCSAVNKLSLNTRYFIRWDRFKMYDNGSIYIGWNQRTKHYAPGYELTVTKSNFGLPKHKTSENTLLYIKNFSNYQFGFIFYYEQIYTMNIFHIISFSHILIEFKFPKSFWKSVIKARDINIWKLIVFS